MKSFIPAFQLGEAVFYIVSHGSGGIGRLFGEAEQHAAFPVDAGIGGILVIQQRDFGYIRKADGIQILHPRIEECGAFQRLDGIQRISHIYQILLIPFIEISGRHGKVLGRKQLGDQFLGKDIVQVGGFLCSIQLFLSLLFRFIQLGFAAFQGGFPVRQLFFLFVQRVLGGAQTVGQGSALLLQLFIALVYFRFAAFQIRNGLIQLGDSGFQLLLGLLQGFQCAVDISPANALGRQRFIYFSQSGLQVFILIAVLDQGNGLLLLLGGQVFIIFNGGNGFIKQTLSLFQFHKGVFQLCQLLLPFNDLIQTGGSLGSLLFQLSQQFCDLLVLLIQLLLGVVQGGVSLAAAGIQGGFAFFQGFLAFLQGGFSFTELLLSVVKLAHGFFKLFVDGGIELFVQGVDLIFIQFDLYPLEYQARFGHGSHAVDPFQFNGKGIVYKGAQLQRILSFIADRRYQRGDQIAAQLRYHRGADGIVPGGGKGADAPLDIHHGHIGVHTILKGQQYDGIVFGAGGGDLFNIVQRGHGLLQRLGNGAFHFFGAGSRVGSHEHNIGKAHFRQQIGGHFGNGNISQHQDQDHGYQHRKRLFYTVLRNHGVLLAKF